jgi:DNA recombination protein RmuC
VGSLETQVLTQAKRFEDLKVEHQGRAVESLEPIEAAVRPLAKLSVDPGPPVRLVAGDEA